MSDQGNIQAGWMARKWMWLKRDAKPVELAVLAVTVSGVVVAIYAALPSPAPSSSAPSNNVEAHGPGVTIGGNVNNSTIITGGGR